MCTFYTKIRGILHTIIPISYTFTTSCTRLLFAKISKISTKSKNPGQQSDLPIRMFLCNRVRDAAKPVVSRAFKKGRGAKNKNAYRIQISVLICIRAPKRYIIKLKPPKRYTSFNFFYGRGRRIRSCFATPLAVPEHTLAWSAACCSTAALALASLQPPPAVLGTSPGTLRVPRVRNFTTYQKTVPSQKRKDGFCD